MCKITTGRPAQVGMKETSDAERQQRVGSGRPDRIGGQPVPRHPREVRKIGRQQIQRPSAGLRRFGACVVGFGVFLRGLIGIGTLGISEGLWAGAKKLSSFIYNKATGMKTVPEGNFVVNLPGGGGDVSVNSDILPKRIPHNMAVEDLQKGVKGKIERGYGLLQDLLNDNPPARKCTLKDMTDIMFYIQVRGQAKKGNFSKGAFSIPDPGQRIRKFLDTCSESYQRASSHIEGFQDLPGGKHRGIDVDGSAKNLAELLPYERKTCLYGSLQENDALQMPEDRLFIKLETHGCWLTRPRGERDTAGPGRTARFHDLGAFWGHTFSFLSTRGKGSAAGTFKERIPDGIKSGFRKLVELAPSRLKPILTQNNPTERAKGIRVMFHNVTEALRELEPKKGKGMNPYVQYLKNFISTLSKYGDVSVRIGNEVILTGDDLGI